MSCAYPGGRGSANDGQFACGGAVSICSSTKNRTALSCGKLDKALLQSLKDGLPYMGLQYWIPLIERTRYKTMITHIKRGSEEDIANTTLELVCMTGPQEHDSGRHGFRYEQEIRWAGSIHGAIHEEAV